MKNQLDDTWWAMRKDSGRGNRYSSNFKVRQIIRMEESKFPFL